MSWIWRVEAERGVGETHANMRLGNNLGNKFSETQANSEAQNPVNTGSIA